MWAASPTEHSPWGWVSVFSDSLRAICSVRIRKGNSALSRRTETPVTPNEKGFCSQNGSMEARSWTPGPPEYDTIGLPPYVMVQLDGRGPIMVYGLLLALMAPSEETTNY